MTEGSETRPPAPRERNWDALAAVIAGFIGLLALLVSGYTAHLQREQVRAQVWPRVQLSRSQERHLVVMNKGSGPARVRAVRVEVDGRPVKKWSQLVTALGHKPEHFGSSTLNRVVLSAGERIEAFTAHDNDAGRALFAAIFVEQMPRLGILICYCSVLDECWLAGGRVNEEIDPDRQVSECPIRPEDRFAD